MYGARKDNIHNLIVKLLELGVGRDEIRSPVSHFFNGLENYLVAGVSGVKEYIDKSSCIFLLLS